MPLVVRQVKTSTRTSGTSYGNAFASAVLAGSLLVAHASVYNAGGAGEPTLSDNVNGTWGAVATTGYGISGDADSELWLWSFPNSGAGSITVTVNPPGTAADMDLTLFEITGAATSAPRDISVTNSGLRNVAQPSVVSGPLAQANEILISSMSHVGDNQALTHDAADGFTLADENESNSTGQTFLVQYKIVAATTTVTVDGTLGGVNDAFTWFTGVASFKEAAAGGRTTKNTRSFPLGLGLGLSRGIGG